LKVDFNRDVVASMINEILISIFFEKGSGAVLKFFNALQPLLFFSWVGCV
jgi:DNA-directed RNA polymerase-5 subunit 1